MNTELKWQLGFSGSAVEELLDEKLDIARGAALCTSELVKCVCVNMVCVCVCEREQSVNAPNRSTHAMTRGVMVVMCSANGGQYKVFIAPYHGSANYAATPERRVGELQPRWAQRR